MTKVVKGFAGIAIAVLISVMALLVFSPGSADAYAGWQYGNASWYNLYGNTTAYGDVLEPDDMTVASRTFEPGTVLTICYTRCAYNVTVTDWGPAAWTGRELDMNKIVADRIGLTYSGVGTVRYRVTGYNANYWRV